ncbi:MAG: hypothetical protein GXP43_01260 [bacterium]|nr:hypothetical protein [bacterium]
MYNFFKTWAYSLIVEYFKFWSKLKLALWRPTIIGFTGSIGKTSFLYILDSILTSANLSHKSSFKANSEIGLPLNILGLTVADNPLGWFKDICLSPFAALVPSRQAFYLAEMGIDSIFYPKNMDFLLSIFVPDIAVGLEVSLMHSLQFSQEANLTTEPQILKLIARQKTKLLKAVLKKGGFVIYNKDNQYLKQQMDSFLNKHPQYTAKTLTLSLADPKADIFVKGRLADHQFNIDFTYQKNTYHLAVPHLALFPEYARLIAAAAVIALSVGADLNQIQAGLNQLKLPGRFSIFSGIKNTTILDSSYNAPYDAVIRLLNHFYHLFPNRPKILVLGEMRELGPLAVQKHQELAKIIAKLDFKHLFLVGRQMNQIFLPAFYKLKPKSTNIAYFDSSQKLGRHLKRFISGGEALFFKGSQNTIFLEEAIKPLLLNPQDKKHLVRQSPAWLKRKAKFFKSLLV